MVIATRLTKSVQHEFDNKLETIRADFRKSEELFRADLRAKETQIAVIRSGALAGLASRQAALDKRRLEAVDQLWLAVTALAPLKAASIWMGTVNFDVAAKEAAKNPRMREVFGMLAAPFDPTKIQSNDAAKARPFVSEIAWALFSAYQAIILFAVTQINILKIGLDKPELLTTDAVTKLVKVALPHYSDYIAKYGSAAYHLLLDELESGLLRELQKLLEGGESDKASVEQAVAILKESDRVMETISQTANVPK